MIYLIELLTCFFFGSNQNFKNPKYEIFWKSIWWEWCCSIRSNTTKLIVFFNCAVNASKNNFEEGKSYKVMWSKGFCLHSNWYGVDTDEKNRMCRWSLCHQFSTPAKCICFHLNIRIISRQPELGNVTERVATIVKLRVWVMPNDSDIYQLTRGVGADFPVV